MKNCKQNQISPSLCKIHPITPLLNKNQGLCGKSKIKKFTPLIVVPGQYCEQLELITSCTTGMFGTKNIEYTKKKIPLILNNGKTILPQESDWPDPSCSWSSTRIQTKTTVQCEPYSVNFDPFSKVYVDKKFKGNICEKSPCDLEGKLGKWLSVIREKDILDLEESEETICVEEKTSEIWGESIPRQPIHSFCYYTYGNDCGYLVNGNLLLTTNANSFNPSNLIRNCSNIKPIPYHFKEQFTSLADKSLHIACTLSMLRVLNAGAMSPHDLWYLQPKNIGYGYWYYLEGGNIHSCLTELRYLDFSNKTQVEEYVDKFKSFWDTISVDLDYNRYGIIKTRGKLRPLFESKIDGFLIKTSNN